MQKFGYARIELWRFDEAIPDSFEPKIRTKKKGGYLSSGYFVWVHAELRLTNSAKGLPSASFCSSLKSFRVVQPQQQIAYWILDGELVKIIGIKATPFELCGIDFTQKRQNAQEGFLSSAVCSYVKSQAIFGNQKRSNCPIMTI